MGYYTTFELEVIEGPDVINNNPDAFDEYFRAITGYALESFSDGIKWYSHDSDMLEISTKFPTSLFQLKGIGEEFSDIWKEYYLNGKSARAEAKIVFEEPDLTKLREPT